MPHPRCLVLDLGAGSGRAMLAELTKDGITLRELHRFSGYEQRLADGPAWDMAAIFAGADQGLRLAVAAGGIGSVAVDSWGVDFGLVDAEGDLVDQPRTYRHARGPRGFAALAPHHAAISATTGVQVLPIATIFHLQDWLATHPVEAARAGRFLMMADLVAHHLSGVGACEKTLARTSGLTEAATGEWSEAMCALAGLELRLRPPVVPAGTVLGPMRAELGFGPIPVVTAAAHDTASAVLALAPAEDEAFLIAGSWNLIGIEVAEGVPQGEALAMGFGLEGGVAGRATLLKSLPGLYLLRKLRDSWQRHGNGAVDFAQLAALALAAVPTDAIDPSDPIFFDPPDMIAVLQSHRPGLDADNLGSLARAIYQGLAAEIAACLQDLGAIRGMPLRRMRLGGGGALDAALCTLIARATGVPVLAGPVEASATGNALVQFVAQGVLPSIEAGRALCSRAVLRSYAP